MERKLNYKYLFLLILLLFFGAVVTGILIYRAHQTDLFFESAGSELTGQENEDIVI